MDIGTLGSLVGIGTVAVGSVIWSIRQEGRINGHDTLFSERAVLQDTQYNNIVSRLDRIEDKVDDLGKK